MYILWESIYIYLAKVKKKKPTKSGSWGHWGGGREGMLYLEMISLKKKEI